MRQRKLSFQPLVVTVLPVVLQPPYPTLRFDCSMIVWDMSAGRQGHAHEYADTGTPRYGAPIGTIQHLAGR